MGTTTHEDRPATTALTAGPGRPFWRDTSIIAVASAVLALAGHTLWQDAATCDDGFACLGTELLAVVFSGVATPVVAWVLWRLCRIPRAFFLAVAATTIGHVLADVAGVVQEITHGLTAGAPMAAAPVYVVVGAVSGVAAALVVGRGSWSWWLRLLVVVALALTSVAVHARYAHMHLQHRESELRAVGETMYLPDISDRATPSYASRWSDATVRISYLYDPPPGGRYDFPELTLVRATPGACSGAEVAGYSDGLPQSRCRATTDGFVADDGINHYVGVTRGGTVLVWQSERYVFDDEEVAAALRAAAAVTVAEMARL